MSKSKKNQNQTETTNEEVVTTTEQAVEGEPVSTETNPEEVKNEVKKMPMSVSEEEMRGRKDLRDKIIFTIDGDDRGSVKPLINLTVTEVIAVGKELGLPEWMINKVPTDGLCGKTDEDKFGFSYSVLDKYIRTGEIEDLEVKKKIDEMHQKNAFKLKPMPSFEP